MEERGLLEVFKVKENAQDEARKHKVVKAEVEAGTASFKGHKQKVYGVFLSRSRVTPKRPSIRH
jgi:hypothetical protein